ESLHTLMQLERYTQQKHTSLTLKKLMIHIEENRYKTELIAFLEKVEHFSFPVEVINVYEEVAKRFWKYHQTVFEEEADIHLLIIGYEAFGQQIAQVARKSYHQSNRKQKMRSEERRVGKGNRCR